MSNGGHTEQVNIIIVDPHPVVREGLRNSFNNDPIYNVVAEAGDAAAALFAGQQHQHHILMTNAFLMGVSILNVVEEHKQAFPETKIVVCYTPEETSLLHDFIEVGADALIGQNAMSQEHIAAAKAVMAGGVYLSANIARCFALDRKKTESNNNAYNLTQREVEILQLLANGLSNKEVANTFDLSVRTAEAHRLSIRRKTNANTLSDLVRIAKALGLVSSMTPTSPAIASLGHENVPMLEQLHSVK